MKNYKKELFFIQGMSCTACSSGIESALKRKKGIQTIQVDLLNHKGIVVFDEELINLDDIFAFIRKLGYTPIKQSWVEKIDHRLLTPKRKIIISACFTLLALYFGMAGMISPTLIPAFVTPIFSLTIELICALVVMHMGRDFYFKGFKALKALHPTMDSLVALGSGSALLYSLFSLIWGNGEVYFESICVILLFVLIGKTIEEKAKQNTQSSLLSLASLKESQLIRITEQGQQEPIMTHQIQIGDILQINPQTIIPTEGILIEGSANLDLSNLTGESLPLRKKIGDDLDSGALNLNTTFLMQCTQKPQDSNYWKILDLVQNALVSKPPIAKIADRIAHFFVPFVILIASLGAFYWGITTKDTSIAFEVFCSVLLISCPCALGLATPLALNIANNLSNQQGIFFKDAGILERIGKTQIVFFDKTGTLTQKELHISKIVSLCEISQEKLLQITASLENHSPHIIAQSILQESKHIPLLESQNVEIQEGIGLKGDIQGQSYKIGNAQIFKQTPEIVEAENGIIVWIGEVKENQEKILGYILLQEKLRKEVLEVIQSLKRDQIKPVLLSGDRKENVEKIANLLGIDFHAQALPQDKLSILEAQNDKITMMVGDGINDMLALSKAKISVSMGEGSKGAMASSSLIILNNHLKNIPYAIALSRATLKNIKQNLFWAFAYNALMIPIACGVLSPFGIALSPMLASLAMTLSSLSVVANAQRLKNFKGDLMHTLTLQIPSMHCSHCTSKIKTFLSDLKGIGEVKFDLESKKVEISYLAPATEEQIKEAIRDSGFEVN